MKIRIPWPWVRKAAIRACKVKWRDKALKEWAPKRHSLPPSDLTGANYDRWLIEHTLDLVERLLTGSVTEW